MSNSSEKRATSLLGMLAAALAVIAVVSTVVGIVREVAPLGLIAAAIAAVLAAAIVWLAGSVNSLSQELHEAKLESTRLASTSPAALTESVTQRITGQTPAVVIEDQSATSGDERGGTIRTPAGDLTDLDLGDISDLADPDTGLLGERYFVVTLGARVAAARRHLRPLALVLIEAVTDASNSAAGIEASLGADVIRETLRDADTLCRLQSGQFAVLLEDTPENGAIWTVERIRRRLGEQLDDVTVWAGIACYPANGFDGPEVLDRAREALVQAREWRQDRTEVADT